jgi:hypothetical protein
VEYEPAAHLAHTAAVLAPSALEYRPGAQRVQSVEEAKPEPVK